MRSPVDVVSKSSVPDEEHGSASAVKLEVLGPQTKLQIQAWQSDTATPATAQSLLGAPWPLTVGSVNGKGTRALCYSPVDWLVVSDLAPAVLLEKFERSLGETGFTVTDQSQGLAALRVSGGGRRDLLSRACGLDLHPKVFAVGSCARTRLAHVAVLIDAPDADSFTCYVARSYLEYLHDWLADAAT